MVFKSASPTRVAEAEAHVSAAAKAAEEQDFMSSAIQLGKAVMLLASELEYQIQMNQSYRDMALHASKRGRDTREEPHGQTEET